MWVKLEAYALKQLLMGDIKKAHNKRRTCASSSSNMGHVVVALLQRPTSQWEFTENCTMRKKQTWVDKHRSLLKRRSSEAECYVIEKARGVSQSKEDILSLYGVRQAQMNNEEVPEKKNIEDVIDLTDTSKENIIDT